MKGTSVFCLLFWHILATRAATDSDVFVTPSADIASQNQTIITRYDLDEACGRWAAVQNKRFNERLAEIEARFAQAEHRIIVCAPSRHARIAELEARVGKQLDSMGAYMDAALADMTATIESLRMELASTKTALDKYR